MRLPAQTSTKEWGANAKIRLRLKCGGKDLRGSSENQGFRLGVIARSASDAASQGIPFSRTRRLVPPWGAVCYRRVHGLVHGTRFVIGGFHGLVHGARFVIGGFTDWSMGRGNPGDSFFTDSQARPSMGRGLLLEGRACESARFTPWLCGSVREMYSVLRVSKDWIAAP